MTTQWLPGIVVLAVGLGAGVLYLLLTKRKSAPAPADGLAVQDTTLEAQRLIEELKELQQSRHQLDAETYRSEHARLERAAAQALRERDRQTDRKPAPSRRPPPSPVGFFANHPQLKGAAWGAGLMLFFGALGAFLFLDETERTEGGSMTGGTPEVGTPPPPSGTPNTEFEAAHAAALQDPSDVERAAGVVHELLRQQRFEEGAALNERALSFDPFHVENRIHRAVLHAFRGDGPKAIALLRHLGDTYPDAQEALLFAGAIAMERQDRATARVIFEQYIAAMPPAEVPPQLLALLAELRGDATGAP